MPRGGTRSGAGRPKGGGKFGFEATKQIRVPISRLFDIKALLAHSNPMQGFPLYSSKVQAGFPSPADDYIEHYLDLNTEYIKNPAATFFVKATGDSMIEAGIHSGDVLLVDKSLEAADGNIVIAAVGGELTVKRLSKKKGKIMLLPANSAYQPIDITEEQEMVIWGVVTLVLHKPN